MDFEIQEALSPFGHDMLSPDLKLPPSFNSLLFRSFSHRFVFVYRQNDTSILIPDQQARRQEKSQEEEGRIGLFGLGLLAHSRSNRRGLYPTV